MLLSTWVLAGEKEKNRGEITAIQATLTDRKGFSKNYTLQYPPPPVFFVAESGRPKFSLSSPNIPPSLPDSKKVEFRLEEINRYGYALYLEV